jgi:hypothetical protein
LRDLTTHTPPRNRRKGAGVDRRANSFMRA